jgi:hypothetical protein
MFINITFFILKENTNYKIKQLNYIIKINCLNYL